MLLAAERGEVAGNCVLSWTTISSIWGVAIKAGNVVVVLQMAPKGHPDLEGIPLDISFAKTEAARFLIKVGIHDPAALQRIYALPPVRQRHAWKCCARRS